MTKSIVYYERFFQRSEGIKGVSLAENDLHCYLVFKLGWVVSLRKELIDDCDNETSKSIVIGSPCSMVISDMWSEKYFVTMPRARRRRDSPLSI